MKIALNALNLAPGNMGGTETYFRMLYQHLLAIDQENSYRVICYDAMAQDLANDAANVELFTVKRYPKSDPRRHLTSFLKKALRIDYVALALRNLDADIVHFPFTYMYPRRVKQAAVLTFCDMQHEFLPEFFSAKKLSRRDRDYRNSVAIADRVIAISQHTKWSLESRYGVSSDKIDVVHLGIGPEFHVVPKNSSLLKAVQTTHGLNRPFMYYPAATWPHKNHLRLLTTLQILVQRYGFDGDLVLTGVSKQDNDQVRQEVKRLGLTDRVKFLGYLPYNELPCLYNLARLLVFPSLFEGFGIPLVEAMACGCPVVCSNVASIPEVVGDAGLFFNPESEEDMAKVIWDCWNDQDQLRQLRVRGVARAQQFTWAETARKTLEVYRRVL